MRRRWIAIITATALAVAACSNSTPDETGRAEETGRAGDGDATTCDPGLDRALDAWAGAGFSGSVAVTTGGEPECLAGYGLADRDEGTPTAPDTVFSLGSVSKAFTAAAVLRLADEGRLALDDRAGDVLPELTGPAAGVTVEQLLLHTSGLTGSHGRDHRRRGDDHGATLRVGDLVLDESAQRVWRAGTEVRPTARELSLLRYFMHHPGRVLPAEELLEHVWDANADPFTTSVRVILSRLRRKLGDPAPIVTVTGAGYRLQETW